MTQDLLNELLLNTTRSAITSYGYWNTTTNVTIETDVNVYRFSSPKTLIILYLLTLAITLPFIMLGLLALYSNGVSVPDGGFIQLITTVGSARLQREASVGGISGGKLPPKLRGMEVKYGELVDRREERNWHGKGVKRAGFGTGEEVEPLRKGVRYGLW